MKARRIKSTQMTRQQRTVLLTERKSDTGEKEKKKRGGEASLTVSDDASGGLDDETVVRFLLGSGQEGRTSGTLEDLSDTFASSR